MLHFPEIYSNFAASNRFEFIKLRNNLKNLMTMKRYIAKGTLAFILGGLLVSCSHDEDYSGSVVEDKLKTFDEVFIKEFGAISPNQDWGFGNSGVTTAYTYNNVRTRTDIVKYDMTDYPMATTPAPITDAERDYVTKWFQTHRGLSDQGLDISNFYIQYVSGDVDDKPGIWHRYDQNRKDADGNPDTNWDEVFYDNGGMDYLIVGATRDANACTHVLDFNAKSGGPWGVIYIKDGSALQFGYHGSWDSNDYFYFKLASIDVPGVGTGYYVGLSLYGTKYDNGDKELGIQRLQYAEDWILKIIPGDTTPIEPEDITIPVDNHGSATTEVPVYEHKKITKRAELVKSGRVMCEDLANISLNDFDYNDAVFDAYIYRETVTTESYMSNDPTNITTTVSDPTYYAKVVILAAGGTLPLTIHNTKDIHDAFGIGIETLVNTAKTTDDAHFNPFTWTGDTVMIDRIDGVSDVDDIQISVTMSAETLKLTAKEAQPSPKFCVPLGTPWPKERCPISEAYTDFYDYVGEGKGFWDGGKVADNLYNIDYEWLPTEIVEVTETKEGVGSTTGDTVEWGGYQGGPVLIRVRN